MTILLPSLGLDAGLPGIVPGIAASYPSDEGGDPLWSTISEPIPTAIFACHSIPWNIHRRILRNWPGTTHSANTAGNAEKPRQLPGLISKRLFVRSEAGADRTPGESEDPPAHLKG